MNKSEQDFYKQAVEDIKKLVEYIFEECNNFAMEYHYDTEWVMETFVKEFNKMKKEI